MGLGQVACGDIGIVGPVANLRMGLRRRYRSPVENDRAPVSEIASHELGGFEAIGMTAACILKESGECVATGQPQEGQSANCGCARGVLPSLIFIGSDDAKSSILSCLSNTSSTAFPNALSISPSGFLYTACRVAIAAAFFRKAISCI